MTNQDTNHATNTQYGTKHRHSRENGNLDAGMPMRLDFVKDALQTRPRSSRQQRPSHPVARHNSSYRGSPVPRGAARQ